MQEETISPIPPPFWKRAVAFTLDILAIDLLSVATTSMMVLAYAALFHPAEDLVAAVKSMPVKRIGQSMQLIYFFSYFTIAHWYFGRTLGKYFLGLRVVKGAGDDLTFSAALARSLCYPLSGYLTLGIGFLLPIFRSDKKALHDLICGTEIRSDTKKSAHQAAEEKREESAAA